MHFKIKTGHSISNEAEIKLESLPHVPPGREEPELPSTCSPPTQRGMDMWLDMSIPVAKEEEEGRKRENGEREDKSQSLSVSPRCTGRLKRVGSVCSPHRDRRGRKWCVHLQWRHGERARSAWTFPLPIVQDDTQTD